MSTERHLSRKRPSITIDAEAKAEAFATPEPEASLEKEEVNAFGRPEEGATSVEQPAAEPAPVQQPRSSNASPIIAGVLGAVLALAGAYGLQSSGLLLQKNSLDSSVSDRLSTLEANIASGTTSEGEKMAALSTEIAALKDSIAVMSQAASDTSLADRVTAIEQTASLVTPATNTAEVSALASRIATLESQTGDGAAGEVLTTMRNAFAAEINALKAELEAVKAGVSNRAADRGLAAAVAATALRVAVDRGGAFGAELENLAAIMPDAPAVAALRNFAASGVPTRQTLASEFEDAAQAMMAASEPVDPDATMFTKLLDSAKGLVKVRPVGSVEGDTPAARIARIGEALTKSDDATVVAEFAALPASSRTAGATFVERFNARAEADRLISEAVRAASANVGG